MRYHQGAKREREKGREAENSKKKSEKKTHAFNLLLLELWPGARIGARIERLLLGEVLDVVLLHLGEQESRRGRGGGGGRKRHAPSL